jgi:hypothetical protein
VLWHGAGQSSKTWETTPDGREGYQNIFLRRHFAVYMIDQPRRGKAGRSTAPLTITPTPDDQQWFNQFRLGVWPDFFKGVQFSRDPQALDQYFRQMTPDTGPFDVAVTSDATAALFKKIPIIIYYGDNIPEKPTEQAGQDSWRVRLQMARLWRDAVNRHGGDVTVVHLPDLGIRGNTHFAFSDLNNLEVADLLSAFLKAQHLD